MKVLIVLLLISSNSFAQLKKVKEVNNIKVPRGITAEYDTLESQYCIKTQAFPQPQLTIRIKNNEQGFYPVIDPFYHNIFS